MDIKLKLNGKPISAQVDADTVLLDFLRDHGCYSVKRGCDTSNCGLCTVLMDGTPILSCSMLAARADGHSIQTLEGL
ncbi:MAG: 2Fe-2S iron-sulfur cluster-binding protein, partial [Clostridiales bacterium]|nr:2Fe-2S iron-sulfur cluster-binding protein [Clostridiales bacterium]